MDFALRSLARAHRQASRQRTAPGATAQPQAAAPSDAAVDLFARFVDGLRPQRPVSAAIDIPRAGSPRHAQAHGGSAPRLPAPLPAPLAEQLLQLDGLYGRLASARALLDDSRERAVNGGRAAELFGAVPAAFGRGATAAESLASAENVVAALARDCQRHADGLLDALVEHGRLVEWAPHLLVQAAADGRIDFLDALGVKLGCELRYDDRVRERILTFDDCRALRTAVARKHFAVVNWFFRAESRAYIYMETAVRQHIQTVMLRRGDSKLFYESALYLAEAERQHGMAGGTHAAYAPSFAGGPSRAAAARAAALTEQRRMQAQLVEERDKLPVGRVLQATRQPSFRR